MNPGTEWRSTPGSRAGTKRGASARRAADSLVNVVQPRGCIFEAGKSFTTQSNLNSNVLKMQITRPFCC